MLRPVRKSSKEMLLGQPSYIGEMEFTTNKLQTSIYIQTIINILFIGTRLHFSMSYHRSAGPGYCHGVLVQRERDER